MTGTPSVSVVIPYYRGADTLRRALESVQAQSVRALEIIVVNDASPVPLPDSLPAEPVPVRVIEHERNRGIPGARNSGVAAATGEWIAFLDQDDEWLPWKLEEQLRRADEAAPDDVVYSRCVFAGRGDPRAGASLPPRGCVRDLEAGGPRALRRLLRRGNVIPFITVLVRRDALRRVGGLDESYTGGTDDFELVLRLAAGGSRFLMASAGKRPAAVHHFTGANYSDPARWIAEERRALQELGRRYAAVLRDAHVGLSRSHFRFARYLARIGERAGARQHYREALRHDPRWLKPRAALLLSAIGRA